MRYSMVFYSMDISGETLEANVEQCRFSDTITHMNLLLIKTEIYLSLVNVYINLQ